MAHRYWRLDSFTFSSGTLLEVSEINVFESGVDKTSEATYSSTRALDFGAFADWKDGNLSTRAFWNGTTATMVLDIDFGAGNPKNMNGIKIGGFDTAARYPTGVRLSFSDNGTDYTPADTVSGLTYPGNNTLSSLITFSVPLVLSTVAGTCSAGLAVASLVLALTGIAGTGSVSTVLPAIGVVGISATSSAGTMTPTKTVTLTGNAATGSAGTLWRSAAALGNVATGSVGTAAPVHAKAVAGNGATTAVGTLTPLAASNVALTGNGAATAVYLLIPVPTRALTGVAGTSAVGSVTKGAGLSGVSGTVSVGTLSAPLSVVLSGMSAATGVGLVGGTAPKVRTITVTTIEARSIIVTRHPRSTETA